MKREIAVSLNYGYKQLTIYVLAQKVGKRWQAGLQQNDEPVRWYQFYAQSATAALALMKSKISVDVEGGNMVIKVDEK